MCVVFIVVIVILFLLFWLLLLLCYCWYNCSTLYWGNAVPSCLSRGL
jgi:hypothetical protein